VERTSFYRVAPECDVQHASIRDNYLSPDNVCVEKYGTEDWKYYIAAVGKASREDETLIG